jgi:hypothetical protein
MFGQRAYGFRPRADGRLVLTLNVFLVERVLPDWELPEVGKSQVVHLLTDAFHLVVPSDDWPAVMPATSARSERRDLSSEHQPLRLRRSEAATSALGARLNSSAHPHTASAAHPTTSPTCA